MADDFLGGLVGAGASLLGGYFSNQYNKKAAQQAFQAQFDAQNFFNTHAIQQKVSDAKAAGISPEFAFGAGTVSGPSMSAFGDSIGPAMANAGQNLSRAVNAGFGTEQKKAAELTIEGMELDNERKREEINRLRAPGSPPHGDDTDKPGPHGLDPQDAQHTKHTVEFGGKVLSSPWFSDAQSSENRSGEIGEKQQGIQAKIADYVFTAGMTGYLGPSIQKRFERADARARGGSPKGSFWDDVSANEWQWIKRKLGL